MRYAACIDETLHPTILRLNQNKCNILDVFWVSQNIWVHPNNHDNRQAKFCMCDKRWKKKKEIVWLPKCRSAMVRLSMTI